MNISILIITAIFVDIAHAFTNIYGYHRQYPVSGDAGNPLFLTPLINAGKLDEAREAAKVKSFVGNVESYSGYFTVDEKYNSNLFFWFFPAEMNYDTAPVILWLQGGPGASSLFGLFAENGPYMVDNDLNVHLRKFTWSKTLSVLYIDNPVGTGYSFTDHDDGYARNEDNVATNLYNAVQQFFALFFNLQNHPFFISGESYAGKYVPAISYIIHKNNPASEIKINLQGLAIGNGLCDPEHMLHYGDYLYQIGLIDISTKNFFDEKETEAVNYIKNRQFSEAFDIFDSLLNADLSGSSVFQNVTGLSNYYNYLASNDDNGAAINKFIQQLVVRQSIHVGNLTFHTDRKVEIFMKEDIMQSVIHPQIEVLIENYRVLFYNGQLDIIVAYPLTVSFLQNLKWSGADEYKIAPRNIWKISDVVAGYSKTVKNFTEVLVRGAGHMVPMDQPLYAWDLINRFVFNKSI